jgi:hypothetical protein
MQSKMLSGRSEVVFPPRADGKPVRVYEALEPLTCSECGRSLMPGERFTRGLLAVVLCWFCRQFIAPEPDRWEIGIAASGDRPRPWRPSPASFRHASPEQLLALERPVVVPGGRRGVEGREDRGGQPKQEGVEQSK